MKISNVLVVLFLFSISPVFSQDTGDDTLLQEDQEAWGDNEGQAEESSASLEQSNPTQNDTAEITDDTDENDSSQQVIRTLIEIRREKILYGIEDEVLDVLTQIQSEKSDDLNDELLKLIENESSPAILEKVFIIFTETEYPLAVDVAMKQMQLVLDDESYTIATLKAAMTYLGEGKFTQSLDLFYDILDDGNDQVVSYALTQIGKLGPYYRSDELLDLFNKEENEANEIAENILLAWGDLAYEPATDILIELVEDEYAEKVLREYASVALGKIGLPQGFEPVRQLYIQAQDATLRSYALSALVHFDNDQVEEMLYQALRRDSYWKIRVAAAQGLGERQSAEAVGLLEYKLNNDPEIHVKKAAALALGEIETSEASKILLSYFSNERMSESMRIEVLKVLLQQHIAGTADAFSEVLLGNWEKKDSQGKFLEFCCREASLVDFPELQDSYGKMLIHENPYIQIYGIRGIRRNELTVLYDEVLGLDHDGINGLVRREAAEIQQ